MEFRRALGNTAPSLMVLFSFSFLLGYLLLSMEANPSVFHALLVILPILIAATWIGQSRTTVFASLFVFLGVVVFGVFSHTGQAWYVADWLLAGLYIVYAVTVCYVTKKIFLDRYQFRLDQTATALKLTASTVSDALFCLNCDGDIIYANPAAHKMLGAGRSELRLRNVHSFFPSDLSQRYSRILGRILRNKRPRKNPRKALLHLLDAKGVEKALEVTLLLVKHQRGYCLLGAARDVGVVAAVDKERELLSRIIGTVTDAILTADPKGRIRTWNKGAESSFGYAAREVLGKPLSIIVPEEKAGEEMELLARVMRGEPVIRHETVRKRRNGEKFDVSLSLSPILDSRNRVEYVCGVVQDISVYTRAARQMQETQNRLVELADSMPQVVWSTGPDGAVNYYNEQWYTTTGLDKKDASPHSWQEVIHPDDLPTLKTMEEKFRSGRMANEVSFRLWSKPHNMYRWHLARTVPIFNESGEFVRAYGSSTDIHEHKMAEIRLAKARDEAQNANAEKSRFLAAVSHEIRTPIASVLGYTELMQKGEALGIEKRQDYLKRIADNSSHLLGLLNDIMELSASQESKVEERKILPFSVTEEINRVLRSFEIAAREKGISIQVASKTPLPLCVYSDSQRFRQILMNLIGNAVKYTKKGVVKVEVSFEIDAESPLLSVEVSDTGMGISPVDQTHLFEHFSRGSRSENLKMGGNGLGLVISRQFARLLGGDIRLKSSTVGKGSCFVFDLHPKWEVSKGFDEKGFSFPVMDAFLKDGAGENRPLVGVRILLVEDSPDIQFILTSYLEDSGAEVSTASNASDGFLKFESSCFDVILSDIVLPDLDGYTLVNTFRAKGVLGPILALTVHCTEEVREKALRSGCNECLTKPIGKELLVKRIIYWMGELGAGIGGGGGGKSPPGQKRVHQL